ncbi:MAG: hypothetical protein H6R18_863 [Proteobacteria bacterium]|nr:hypothetical protein [Pseudomonadota bacterium]
MLFIHGNLANHLWWEGTLANLPPDFEGVALDLPGNGASPETGVRHTIEYFAGLVDEFTSLLGWRFGLHLQISEQLRPFPNAGNL